MLKEELDKILKKELDKILKKKPNKTYTDISESQQVNFSKN